MSLMSVDPPMGEFEREREGFLYELSLMAGVTGRENSVLITESVMNGKGKSPLHNG